MNLVLAIVWLLGGIGLLVFQSAGGSTGRIGPLGYVFCFVLAAYNVARWYASRSGKEEEAALRIVHEARKRQSRQREREAEYDPNLDFTRRPEEGERPPG